MNDSNLKKAGLKVTLPRMKILHILEGAGTRHLSAEDIYKILLESGDDIALATVYRVLTQFEDAKLVTRHQFAEGFSVFELDHGQHHDHLVCIKCGYVEEFVDSLIEQRQHDAAKKSGFLMTDHQLTIYGICGQCQKN